MPRSIWWFALVVSATGIQAQPFSLPMLSCVAEQTGGFHDYPGDGEVYEPALFHPRTFELEENPVFMLNLSEAGTMADAGGDSRGYADLYITLRMVPGEDEVSPPGAESELECRQVRGADGSMGFSCVNLPPSEMLLLNAQTLRFTRASVGGWTFAGANDDDSGDSIFVEYGRCTPRPDPETWPER